MYVCMDIEKKKRRKKYTKIDEQIPFLRMGMPDYVCFNPKAEKYNQNASKRKILNWISEEEKTEMW